MRRLSQNTESTTQSKRKEKNQEGLGRNTECLIQKHSHRKKVGRNNQINIFTVQSALKLLPFPLDIDVKDILNYRMKYLLSLLKKP